MTEPFGHARNLDVFLQQTLPHLAKERPDAPGLDGLRERAEAERERAYDSVLAILESPQWRGLIIDFAGWIETGSLGRAARRRRRTGAHFAAQVLDQGAPAAEEARPRASSASIRTPAIAPGSPPRSLRYGAEFFAGLYPKKKARRRQDKFGAALSDLQDHLGTLNDLETARAMTESLSGSADAGAATIPATQDLLEAAADARSELLDVKPFWR